MFEDYCLYELLQQSSTTHHEQRAATIRTTWDSFIVARFKDLNFHNCRQFLGRCTCQPVNSPNRFSVTARADYLFEGYSPIRSVKPWNEGKLIDYCDFYPVYLPVYHLFITCLSCLSCLSCFMAGLFVEKRTMSCSDGGSAFVPQLLVDDGRESLEPTHPTINYYQLKWL